MKIAENLKLPVEAVTQTFAILGIRGSGKTNTAVVMTEELLAAKQQVVVIDPVDVWWGLKSSKNGKQPGFAIPVIGGDHADVPLDGAAGSVLADFVADSRASVILSLRHLSMNDQRRFAGDFAKRLYDRKGEQRSPLMLMVDEADEFCPQRIPHGHEAMFGAFDRLVRRGRSSGIGVTLISQRAQVINKDVLSQMETLIAMRVLHKLDRKALEAWIEAHDTEGRREEFLGSLASLGKGDAWIWSPSWLSIFRRIHVRERTTFDSSSTPETGGRAVAPRELAPVDLEKLRESLAQQIEKAKADDPKILRQRIAELEREMRRSTPPPPVDASTIQQAEQRGFERGLAAGKRESDRIANAWKRAHGHLDQATALMGQVIADVSLRSAEVDQNLRADSPSAAPARRAQPATTSPKMGSTPSVGLTGPEQRILDAIAWMESIGVDSPEQTAVAFLAGYTIGGGAFNNPRGALRTKGLVEYAGDCIQLTAAGRNSAHFPDSVLDATELQRRVFERLPGPESRILAALIEVYPGSISNDDLARAAGYTPNGGAYNNPRGRLRTLGLIDYQGGEVRARDLLFPGGGSAKSAQS